MSDKLILKDGTKIGWSSRVLIIAPPVIDGFTVLVPDEIKQMMDFIAKGPPPDPIRRNVPMTQETNEIDVTAEMIEAGRDILVDSDYPADRTMSQEFIVKQIQAAALRLYVARQRRPRDRSEGH